MRLADLELQKLVTRAEAERLTETSAGLGDAIEALRTRANDYRRERIAQLRAQIDGAEASAKAADAKLRYARLGLDRSNRLSDQGVRTGEALEESRSLAEVAELDLASAQETVRVARINLAAAERGIFLGDGYKDAPYSEQRVSELQVEREQLQLTAAIGAASFGPLIAGGTCRVCRWTRRRSMTSSSIEPSWPGSILPSSPPMVCDRAFSRRLLTEASRCLRQWSSLAIALFNVSDVSVSP